MDTNKKSHINRRNFVKSSTVAMGGLMAMPVGAGAYASGSDVIKIGLIGCGGRGTGAAVQALKTDQNLQLVAMADAFRDRLDSSLSNLKKEISDGDKIAVKEAHKYVGFDAYKAVIEQSDVVLIATPPGFRPIHFEAAVAANKHIFMEKPVATDPAGVRRVLKAAEEAKKKKLNVVVGLQRHYQKVYTEWVERLHAGAIGDIHTAHVYWNSRGVWVRDRAGLEKKAGRKITEMEYQMRNWYYFNWLCGDHI
ncbi:MAG: Gfo/Idh/MocA family oxidoreductase, partial [Bacteroidota bacterium]